MKRNVDIDKITDGKLYTANDMVRIGCDDCRGCSACCSKMGSSITLDPYDLWQLTSHMAIDFQGLFENYIELHAEDGLILPNLRQMGEEETCAFLKEDGRCGIHDFRPGICRLFPLGRLYEDGGFRYIHQIYECPKEDKTKVKIKKWLGIFGLKEYEQYVNDWHELLVVCREAVEELPKEQQKVLSLFLLRTFFQQTYPSSQEAGDFYREFYSRLYEAKKKLGLLE